MTVFRTHKKPAHKAKKNPWNTKRARARFVRAFSEPFSAPPWYVSMRFCTSPNNDRPVAVIDHSDGSEACVKVFPTREAELLFWEQFPEALVISLVVQQSDSLRAIRDRTFAEVDHPEVEIHR